MKIIASVIASLLILVLAALAALYSGLFSVSASYPHGAVTEWLLHTAMAQSVRRHAREVPPAPARLAGREREGAVLYREMCAQCHGAPGVAPDELGQGLMPPAPEFAKEAVHWSAEELFWIIKNGVRLTGMPAWGPTHTDEQIWTIAAFLLTLSELTPEKYRQLAGGEPRRSHAHGKDDGAGAQHLHEH